MLNLAIARVGTTLSIINPYTPFTDPYSTTPITTQCTCPKRENLTCVQCNLRHRIRHQSSNIRWGYTKKHPATSAKENNIQLVYHPPTHVTAHPFPAPTQEEINKNTHLCTNPPPRLHHEPPLNSITSAELSRLLPTFPYTSSHWLNDAIISTMSRLMHDCSPYNKERYIASTYFSNQALRDPSHTAHFFKDENSRRNTYKLPRKAPLLLITIGADNY